MSQANNTNDTAKPKSKRTRKAPPTEKPSELAIAASYAHTPGQPRQESGPCAWLGEPFGQDFLSEECVFQVALTQVAKKPKQRAVLTGAASEAFVISDKGIGSRDREDAAQGIVPHWIGSMTECHSLASKVRWIRVGSWHTKADIAQIAAGEVEYAKSEDPEFAKRTILFLVWKKTRSSFGGASQLEVAQEICNVVFTYPLAEKAPAYRDSYSDDDDGPEPADWWKGGGK